MNPTCLQPLSSTSINLITLQLEDSRHPFLFLLFHSSSSSYSSPCEISSSWVLMVSELRLSYPHWLLVMNCLGFCVVGSNWRLTLFKEKLMVCTIVNLTGMYKSQSGISIQEKTNKHWSTVVHDHNIYNITSVYKDTGSNLAFLISHLLSQYFS